MEVRIALTESDFRALVSGGEVSHSQPGGCLGGGRVEVKLILKDIGWDRMEKAIEDFKHGRDRGHHQA